MLLSVVAAELGTCLAVVVFKSWALGLVLLSAGVASGVRWARTGQRRLDAAAEARLRTSRLLLGEQRYAEARAAAEEVLTSAYSARLRAAALTTMAWIALERGNPGRAARVLDHVLLAGAVDPYTLAAVEHAGGRSDRALQTLERAKQTGELGLDAVRLLVDLHATSGDYLAVTATAFEFAAVLGERDLRRIVGALEGAGEQALAASLTPAVDDSTRSPKGSRRLPGRSSTNALP